MQRKWAIIIGSALLLTACKTGAGAQDASSPAAGATRPAAGSPSTSVSQAAMPTRDRTVVSQGHAFPDHALTLGATFAGVTAAKVCVSGWASAHRNVTEALRH